MLLSVSLCVRQTWKDFPFLLTPWIISGLSEGAIQFKATANLIVTFHSYRSLWSWERASPSSLRFTETSQRSFQPAACLCETVEPLTGRFLFPLLVLSQNHGQGLLTPPRGLFSPLASANRFYNILPGSASASPQVISLLSPEWEYVAHTVFFLLYVLIYKYLNILHPFVEPTAIQFPSSYSCCGLTDSVAL